MEYQSLVPSELSHCWMDVRKGTTLVKKLSDEVLAWLFCLQ